jgi:hypothetical protein
VLGWLASVRGGLAECGAWLAGWLAGWLTEVCGWVVC